jgi:small-conductance mechanosensitive channel
MMAAASAPVPGASRNLLDKLASLWADVSGWLRADSSDALIAVAAAVAFYFLVFGLRWSLVRLLGEGHPVTSWRGFARRIVKRTRSPFIAALSAYLVTHVIETPPLFQRAVDVVFVIAFAVQGALWVRELLLALVDRRAADSEDVREFDSAINIIKVLVNVVVWILALILILDNLGVNVTALVAGLGVGGIAIGLAAQGIFSDLFAALAILFDRPFRVGDIISYAGNTGRVEAIGLKTTRIRALSGEQLVMANTKLLEQQVSNMRRIEERRVVMQIGIIYQTPPDVVAALPGEIEAIITAQPDVRFDRAHFFNFGVSSLDFEIVFFVTRPEYEVMMTTRQNVCLGILQRFAALKVEFAYPTQTSFTAAPDGTMIDPRPVADITKSSG